MKFLLQSRIDILKNPGGDTIHIQAVRRELANLGHRAVITNMLKPCLDSFDAVIVFNITRVHETFAQVLHAVRYGLPVFLIPIYHPLHDYFRARHGLGALASALAGNPERFEQLRVASRLSRDPITWSAALRQWSVGYERLQQWCLVAATGIFPNSQLEKELLISQFGLSTDDQRFAVIPVGIESDLLTADPSPFRRVVKAPRFILSVGRYEALKNQLAIVRALSPHHPPLVLIGRRNRWHRAYYHKLKAEVRKVKGTMFESLPRRLVVSAFAAAQTHVLASWTETTGLVSLEAATTGCSIVTTNRSLALNDLPPQAQICDPSSLRSITEALDRALQIKIDWATRQSLAQRYSWPAVTKALTVAITHLLR